jgi:hypothetical protein
MASVDTAQQYSITKKPIISIIELRNLQIKLCSLPITDWTRYTEQKPAKLFDCKALTLEISEQTDWAGFSEPIGTTQPKVNSPFLILVPVPRIFLHS